MKSALKILLFSILLPGCMSAYLKSVGGDADRVHSRIFVTDFMVAWKGALDALKAVPMEVVNRENGTIQTQWVDNTADRNLIEAAGSVNPYLKAQYRFQVTLSKGIYNGAPSVKVTVQKEQQVQRDVLEGWIHQPSDGIQENSLLYRIGRVIEIALRIQDLENQRLKAHLPKLEPESERVPEEVR